MNNINRYQEFELKLRRRPISNDKIEDIKELQPIVDSKISLHHYIENMQ